MGRHIAARVRSRDSPGSFQRVEVPIIRHAKFFPALILLSLTSGFAQPVPFKHIVYIIQENRTPDNLFGSNPNFEPGVDLATSGLNSKGEKIPLTALPLANCYDLDHRHPAFVTQYNKGKMDGFDLTHISPSEGCVVPPNPQFKFVDNSDGAVQPYFDMAKQYGFGNRMFQTQQAASFPAHQFLIAGTSAPTTYSKLFASGNVKAEPAGCISPPGSTVTVIDEDGDESTNAPIYPCFEHDTLTDVLNAAKVTWKFYAPNAGSIWTGPNAVNHICEPKLVKGELVCTGQDWVNNVVLGNYNVLFDIEECKLPAVSWVVPSLKNSDHPKTNDGSGPAWIASIVNAIGTNAACSGTGEVYWKDTAIVLTWDDWGGFYDHVKPFRIGQPNGWGKGFTYGFRVPLLVISAYTPTGYVDNTDRDFGSVLKFIETNFGAPGKPLGPIGPGIYADAYATDSWAPFFSLTSPRSFQKIDSKFSGRGLYLYWRTWWKRKWK